MNDSWNRGKGDALPALPARRAGGWEQGTASAGLPGQLRGWMMGLPSTWKSCLVQPQLRKTLGQTLRPPQSQLPAPPARSGTEPSELTALRGHTFPQGDISRAEFHLPPCSPSTNEPPAEGRALKLSHGAGRQQENCSCLASRHHQMLWVTINRREGSCKRL